MRIGLSGKEAADIHISPNGYLCDALWWCSNLDLSVFRHNYEVALFCLKDLV